MLVLLVIKRARPDALEAARVITQYLESMLCEVQWIFTDAKQVEVENIRLSEIDLCISLGGDGTLLCAARIIGSAQIPILGLSFGHLGFLCNPSDDYLKIIERVLSQEMHVSRRFALDVAIHTQNDWGHIDSTHYFALNDVTLNRGLDGSIVQFEVAVSGNKIDEMSGDGFIISTATGSTGYALACGGPVVTPEFRGMVCVPIAPHTVQARAFLTSSSDCVEIWLSPERQVDRAIYIDGVRQASGIEVVGLTAKRAAHDFLLYDNGQTSFYDSVARVFWGRGSQ